MLWVFSVYCTVPLSDIFVQANVAPDDGWEDALNVVNITWALLIRTCPVKRPYSDPLQRYHSLDHHCRTKWLYRKYLRDSS